MSKVCIPLDIIRNTKLSPRAKLIWAELSLLPQGVIGEFVINQKELSQQLGICVSTLRRALKSLEENKLIQFVGLFEKKYKKYIFKGVEEVPMDFHSGLVQESAPSTENLDASLRCHDKTEPTLKSAWVGFSIENKKPEPEDSDPNLFRLKHQFVNGKPTSDDKCSMIFGNSLYKLLHEKWRHKFPLLNGKDNRPLLNSELIEIIVLKHPSNLGGEKMLTVIDAELQQYTDG